MTSRALLSISDIFDACVCNLAPPILSSFSSLSTFSRALGLFWPGWPLRMAVIVIYRTKYENYELRRHILRKGVRAGLPSFGKKSSEPRSQGKWSRWKLWKKLSIVFTGHLLNMGMNNLFLSLIRGQKKTKTVNRLLKETATHWILL